MKMQLVLLFLILNAISVVAQPDMDEDIPDGASTLSETLANGVNYYVYVPLLSGSATLRLDNLSQLPNNILLFGDDGQGNRERLVLEVKEQSTYILMESKLRNFMHLYLVSLQPFHVQAEKPLNVMGVRTRHFTTVTPSRNMNLVLVENAMGKAIVVGVTPDGVAHYPVYGYKFGTYDARARTITRPNGTTYGIPER